MTELALIKLTRPETSNDEGALLSRIERMERKIDAQASGARATVTTPTPSSPAKLQAVPAEAEDEGDPTDDFETPVAEEVPAAEPETPEKQLPELDITLEQLNNVWAGLFGSLRDVLGARRWAYFREAVPAGVQGNTIILEVAHDFHYQSLNSDDAVTSIVATRASDLLGSQVHVRFRLKAGSTTQGSDEAHEDKIDLDDLEERPEGSSDPAELLAAELGAEVVED